MATEDVSVETTPTPPEKTAPEESLKSEELPTKKKGGGKWFAKIPQEIILSPGGMILVFFALGMEIIDLIPGLGADTLTWELALEAVFMVLLAVVAKLPFLSMIIPFIIERIPGLSDVAPSWLLKMFF